MAYEFHWADIDANRHVHDSVYTDAAAELRYHFITQHNMPPEAFDEPGMGPVYTSLTANFFHEVHLGEILTITYLITSLSPQGVRWKVLHDILKAKGKKAAAISQEGTILNLTTRQPTRPTPEIMMVFQLVQRSPEFEDLSESIRFT